jgi:hypothetical protein
MTELGMYRNAMRAMKNHAQSVWTILGQSELVKTGCEGCVPAMARGREDRSRDPPAEDDEGKPGVDKRTELLVAGTAFGSFLVVLGDGVGVGHGPALLAHGTGLEGTVTGGGLFVDGGGLGLVVGGAVHAGGLDVGGGVDGELAVGHGGCGWGVGCASPLK